MAKPAKITHPPNRAKAKVSPLPATAFKELLQAAEASAAALGVGYAETIANSAKRLTRLSNDAQANGGDADTMRKIADMAFEMRGEGASFGFDVVSQVADSLFRLTENFAGDPGGFKLKVVEMHALALNALLAGGVRSATDDEVAAQIMGALAAAKAKADSTPHLKPLA